MTNDESDGQKEALDQGPDAQARGGGLIALDPSHVAQHLLVPSRGRRVPRSPAAGVHRTGTDDAVGHCGLTAGVGHGGQHGHRGRRRPQHAHLVLLLEHLVGWGTLVWGAVKKGWELRFLVQRQSSRPSIILVYLFFKL